MQNGKLLMGSIFENITISAPWLTMDDAWEAAEAAGIAPDIREMPMGMQTMISEGQGGLRRTEAETADRQSYCAEAQCPYIRRGDLRSRQSHSEESHGGS